MDEASHLERRISTQSLNRSILHALLPPPLPRSYETSGRGCHIPWEERVKQVIFPCGEEGDPRCCGVGVGVGGGELVDGDCG